MTNYWQLGCAGLCALALTIAYGSRQGGPRQPEAPSFLRLACHDGVHRIAFSPDGKTLAAGTGIQSGTGEIKLWELANPRQPRTLSGHRFCIVALAFAPDGLSLGTASWDAVTRWHLASQQPIATQREDFGPSHVGCLAFRPDLKQLAVAPLLPSRPTLRLRRIPAGSASLALDCPESVAALAFSPDGRFLAAGGVGHVVRLYDTGTGAQCLTLAGESNIAAVAFAPDGQSLAAGDWRGRVRVWDLSEAKARITWAGDTAPIYSLAFSPDGRRLAVGDFSGSLRLWDAHAGTELARYQEHADAVTAAAFSPDGRWLASGSLDTTVGLWRLDEP